MAVKKKNVSLKMGKHKSRSGGLTAAGRKKYNAATGSNLKAPQPGGGARKRSFCARMSGVKGPMKKPNGKPTRKALALRKWKCQWSRTIIERDMAKTYDEDGTETGSISERKEKKKNPLLDPIEQRLLREDNVAPASKFIKRQNRLKKLLEDM